MTGGATVLLTTQEGSRGSAPWEALAWCAAVLAGCLPAAAFLFARRTR